MIFDTNICHNSSFFFDKTKETMKKRGRNSYECDNCASIAREASLQESLLVQQIDELEESVEQWKKTAYMWEERYKNFLESQGFSMQDVVSDDCHPSKLRTHSFKKYLRKLVGMFPVLEFILGLFISSSQATKYNRKSADPKWKIWADMYRSFLVDMFLRARAPKTIGRTTLLLSAYFLLTNLSEPCWRLLERFKIVCSKQYVEKWLRSSTKTVQSNSTMLIVSYDNCSVWQPAGRVNSIHNSNMLNFVVKFVVELPDILHIDPADLWRDVDRVEFGHWLQSTNDDAMMFSLDCWVLFDTRSKSSPIKFLYNGSASEVRKSDITFLEPIINISTNSYQDIRLILDEIANNYIVDTDRTFLIVSGDQSSWIKMWVERKKFPEKYHWLIPVPGEWHWTWHILKAIYRLYGVSILLPFSQILGIPNLDLEANNFHNAEDFLEIVTIAVTDWVEMCVKEYRDYKKDQNLTALEWLHDIKTNRQAYELGYACIHYFIPYWVTRSTLKWNKFEDYDVLWRHWLHLFVATNKKHYAVLTIRFLWILSSLNPEVVQVYNKYRVLSFTGEPGTGIPIDGVNELVSTTDFAHFN